MKRSWDEEEQRDSGRRQVDTRIRERDQMGTLLRGCPAGGVSCLSAVRMAALSCEEQTWLNSSLHVPPVKQPHMKHIKGLWTRHPVGFLGGGATAGLLGGGVLPGSG